MVRFYNTFNFVFRMTYGTKKEALRAARIVRSIHNKVHGHIITSSSEERLGVFESGDMYTANNAHALFWVQATLLDSAVLIYELLVGMILRVVLHT